MSATWRTWLPHRAKVGRLRVFQIVGGRRWSLALCIKPEAD